MGQTLSLSSTSFELVGISQKWDHISHWCERSVVTIVQLGLHMRAHTLSNCQNSGCITRFIDHGGSQAALDKAQTEDGMQTLPLLDLYTR